MVTVDAAAAAAADGTEDDEAPSLPFFPFPLLSLPLPLPSFPLEPLSPWPSLKLHVRLLGCVTAGITNMFVSAMRTKATQSSLEDPMVSFAHRFSI